MANRTGRGQWKPGQSGNPGGRPAKLGPISELAREHSEEAIQLLITIMRDEKASRAERAGAANALLDRGLGKPTQYQETTITRDGLDELMDQIDGQGVAPLRAVG